VLLQWRPARDERDDRRRPSVVTDLPPCPSDPAAEEKAALWAVKEDLTGGRGPEISGDISSDIHLRLNAGNTDSLTPEVA
jgi:hypothetical protein